MMDDARDATRLLLINMIELLLLLLRPAFIIIISMPLRHIIIITRCMCEDEDH